MKNTTNLIFILLIGILCTLSSCDDFLDLEPETSLSSAVAFDNIQGIEAGINGAYSTIHADWVERQYVFAACFASNVKEVNSLANSNYSRTLQHAVWTDMFNTSGYLWQMSFSGIDLSNQVLKALPNIDAVNDQIANDKTRLQGEALFLRGMLYFVLNRFYAQPQNGLSVPLLTEPFQPGDQPVRAEIETLKAQVIADLLEAENLMTGILDNNGRANIWAVKALLARVYFEYKDYVNAELYANDVITNGPFALIDGNVAAAYSTSISSENIFTFLSLSTDRAAANLFEIFSLNSNNVQLSLSDTFWDLIDENPSDIRLTELHEDFMVARACHKYDDRDMNLAYIRLPEMYLIRAESKVENGNLDSGLTDLNRLRQRVGLAATTYTDKNDLLEKIFIDRSLELSMEGDHFHNLKRLERPIGGYTWEEAKYKLVFFLPEKEVQLNPNLVQNDTW